MRHGFVKAQRKAPLPVPDERNAEERDDLERSEFLRVGARVGHRIADHDHFACTRLPDELLSDEVHQAMNADQAGHVFQMPFMVDDHLLCGLVDFDERTDRELQIGGHSGADNLHHFVDVGPESEIPADRLQKFEIEFRLCAQRHVARDRQQSCRLGVQTENRGYGNVPPLGFTAQGAEETHESRGFASCCRLDRRFRSLTMLAVPELDPRSVEEGPDVFDAEQFLAALHREQVAFEVEHLDAVRAALDDAAGERVALAQSVFGQLALGDIVEIADDTELAIRKGNALNLPVVGLAVGSVFAQLGGAGCNVRLAGFQRVAKPGQSLGSERLGPGLAHDRFEVTPDQRMRAAKRSQRNGTGLAHSKLRIDDVHAEGRVLDQMKEGVVIRAQQFLGPFALGNIEVGGKRFRGLAIGSPHRGPAGSDPSLDTVVAENPVVNRSGWLASVKFLERRLHRRPISRNHVLEQCPGTCRAVAGLLRR